MATILGLLLSPGCRRTAPNDLRTGFRELERRQFNVAAEQFALARDGHDPRSAAYGQAAALLASEPFDSEKRTEARGLFESVQAGNPNDTLGVASAYFLARLEQREPGDSEAAKRRFLEIAERHPSHPLGQYALVKYATMELFVRSAGETPAECFARLEPLGERLTHLPAKRGFHHVMGQACAMFGLPAAAELRHYRAALACGFAKDNLRADIILRVAELARRTGDVALAREHYERFLHDFPRERRAYLVRELHDRLSP